MFERFTDRSRRVVILAQEEARLLDHNYIGTEHLLLGLIHEGSGVAARALATMGIRQELVRQRVEEIIGRGQQAPAGHIPFTPRAKKVLQLALREALQLDHDYIGTEHILLGLIREGDGVAAQVLVSLGADLNSVRQQVINVLRDHPGDAEATAGTGRGVRSRTAGRGQRKLLAELLNRFDSIESRLSALERRVGAVADLEDISQQIARVRADKEAAIETEDFEAAASLRDRERQLLSQKDASQQQRAAAERDLPSLSEELERLHALLREHGIEPQDGAA